MALTAGKGEPSPQPPAQIGARDFNPLLPAAIVGIVIVVAVLIRILWNTGDPKWEVVVMLLIGAALVGAGIFTEISATAQGFTIKTIAESLAKVNEGQIEAIDKVKTAVAVTAKEISAPQAKATPDVDGLPDEAESRVTASNTSIEYSRDVHANLRQAEEALQASVRAQEWLNGYLASLRGSRRS